MEPTEPRRRRTRHDRISRRRQLEDRGGGADTVWVAVPSESPALGTPSRVPTPVTPSRTPAATPSNDPSRGSERLSPVSTPSILSIAYRSSVSSRITARFPVHFLSRDAGFSRIEDPVPWTGPLSSICLVRRVVLLLRSSPFFVDSDHWASSCGWTMVRLPLRTHDANPAFRILISRSPAPICVRAPSSRRRLDLLTRLYK